MRVETIDPVERVARTRRGGELPFDELVLATGARPRRLPLDLPKGVHELRTLADARALRDELVPGLAARRDRRQASSAPRSRRRARTLGVHVTIVEAADAPLARVLGEEVGVACSLRRWRQHGVDVRLAHRGRAHPCRRRRPRALHRAHERRRAPRRRRARRRSASTPARELMPKRPAAHLHPAGDVIGPGHWTAAALDGAAAARRILGLPARAATAVVRLVGPVRAAAPGRRHAASRGRARVRRWRASRSRCATSTRRAAVRAALLANRPLEAGALRRRLAESALAFAA